MQTLIQELLSGTTEYRDDGIMLKHPPTTQALKSARAITKLLQMLEAAERINDTSARMLHNQETEIASLKEQLEKDMVLPDVKDENNIINPAVKSEPPPQPSTTESSTE